MARKEKKYHFIYKTTNVLSGRYYIGMHSTSNLDDGYLGSGNRLRLAVRKHGKENFIREILEYCVSREELKKREEELVTLNEVVKIDCMNLVVGGGGFMLDDHHFRCSKAGGLANALKLKNDLDHRAKISKISSNTMKDNHKNGKIKYDTFTGKQHSEETKLKISKIKTGQGKGGINSQFGTCWITNEIESKKIMKGDLIPDGWRLGRKII
jgi:hypothetical protein